MSQYNEVKWRVWRAIVRTRVVPDSILSQLPSDEMLMRHIQRLEVSPDLFWEILVGDGPKPKPSIEERLSKLEAAVFNHVI